MRLRPQIPFLLTSKPLNSFEFVFHGEPENENFSIGMENEEKPQKINLPCSNRISLPRFLPNHGFSFQVSLSWNVFFYNFTLACRRKVFRVYFGRLAVTAMCLELRHKDIRVGESLKVTLRQVGEGNSKRASNFERPRTMFSNSRL